MQRSRFFPRLSHAARQAGSRLRAWPVLLALAALFAIPAHAQRTVPPAELRFGILPLSGPLESRKDWQPLLAAMGDAIGQPIQALSVTSYEALGAAIERQEVDLAFLSGKMALDAVTLHGMRVVAQVASADGEAGYRALLLARKDGPVNAATLLQSPGRWRLARGSNLSMSGYVVPHLQLFLPHGIRPESYFRSEWIGTHQDNALAVANGEADLATNNTADLARFRQRFPAEAERLDVLWSSELIPHALIVARRQLPPATQDAVARFLTGYGRGNDEAARRARQVLKQLHDFSGFLPADDRALEFSARINHELARQSALGGQWVSAAARQDRLRRLDQAYQAQLRQLRAAP